MQTSNDDNRESFWGAWCGKTAHRILIGAGSTRIKPRLPFTNHHMNHDWIMKFLGVYIKDPNILWLIKKYLKAGVMIDGVFKESIDGSAQGNIMSPIIANIYMHNVLILWYKIIFSKETKEDSFLVVYADDFIAGFQYKWEAEK